MNKNELTNYINTRNWDTQLKGKFLSILNSSGKYVIQFLWDSSHELGADIIVEHLVNGFYIVNKAKQLFLQGSPSEFLALIDNADNQSFTAFGDYVFPAALEILESADSKNFINQHIVDFVYSRFLNIYPESLEKILNSKIVLFLSKADVVLQFNRWYARKWLGTFLKHRVEFVRSLESNNEKLTSGNFLLSGQMVVPSVANWLKAYLSFSSKPSDQRQTFEEIEFLQNFSEVKKLPPSEKTNLANLIKLYNWLHNPIVNESELNEYEEKINNNSNSYIQSQKFEIPERILQPVANDEIKRIQPEALKSAILNVNTYKDKMIQEPKPSLPSSLPKPLPKITDQTKAKIDIKLDELEKRVGNKS